MGNDERQTPSATGPWGRPAPASGSKPQGGGPWAAITSEREGVGRLERLGVRGPGPGGYVLANLAARAGAKLLDSLVLALALVPGLIVAWTWDRRIGAIVGGVAALGVWLQQWTLIAMSGQTLGKRWLGLRVIGEQGERVGWRRGVFMRVWAMTAGSLVLVGIPLIVDPLLVFGRRRQCLHDRLARTLVIEARTPGDPHA